MSLQRVARELDETARQTGALADGVTDALEVLSDTSLTAEEARARAIRMIVSALQGQDRIAQRCHDMAIAVRQLALLPAAAPQSDHDEIWSRLVLDELRIPSLSGIAAQRSEGDVELF